MARRSDTHLNRLLSALSPDDLAAVRPHLELMDFANFHVFEAPNVATRHVYFIEQGIASVVAVSNGERRIEVGLIGLEGLTGISVLLGSGQSPHSTYGQVPGRANRMDSGVLQQMMQERVSMSGLLLRFAQVFMVQTAQTALSNGRAKIDERLARWLLMARDRLESDDLPLTHEFLAMMLGVRRAGVTVALHEMERRGLIRSGRGHVFLLDRAALEKSADGSYGIPEAEYRRLIC